MRCDPVEIIRCWLVEMAMCGEGAGVWLYLIVGEDAGICKVGIARHVGRRMKTLQTSAPAKLHLQDAIPFPDRETARLGEQIVHRKLIAEHLSGEWFRYRLGMTDAMFNSVDDFAAECYSNSPDRVADAEAEPVPAGI